MLDPELITTPDTSFERTTVSPHVNQFLADYMFVRDRLIASRIEPMVDMGMGDGDLSLSIVNDAYNQQHVSEQIKHDIAVKQYRISAEA